MCIILRCIFLSVILHSGISPFQGHLWYCQKYRFNILNGKKMKEVTRIPTKTIVHVNVQVRDGFSDRCHIRPPTEIHFKWHSSHHWTAISVAALSWGFRPWLSGAWRRFAEQRQLRVLASLHLVSVTVPSGLRHVIYWHTVVHRPLCYKSCFPCRISRESPLSCPLKYGVSRYWAHALCTSVGSRGFIASSPLFPALSPVWLFCLLLQVRCRSLGLSP